MIVENLDLLVDIEEWPDEQKTITMLIPEIRVARLRKSILGRDLGKIAGPKQLEASEWVDEKGLTWLETASKIKLFSVKDARSPYPLTQEEQSLLFQELPDYLARMALYKVNTGCREQEVCRLRWDYEVKVPELDTSVFIIPGDHVKNGDERLVVLNRVAKSVVESMRGVHPTHVFAIVPPKDEPRPVSKMYGTAWKQASERAADKWVERHGGEPAPGGSESSGP